MEIQQNIPFPDRITKERPFGQKIYRNKHEKGEKLADDKESSEINITGIPTFKGSLSKAIPKMEKGVFFDPKDSVVTLVGVTKQNMHMVKKYFRDNGMSRVKWNSEDLESWGNNWVFVDFGDDIHQISKLPSTIVLSEDCTIGCFSGKVSLDIEEEKEIDLRTIFRLKQNEEDLTAVAQENKSLLIKIREFVLGESIIPVRVKA